MRQMCMIIIFLLGDQEHFKSGNKHDTKIAKNAFNTTKKVLPILCLVLVNITLYYNK